MAIPHPLLNKLYKVTSTYIIKEISKRHNLEISITNLGVDPAAHRRVVTLGCMLGIDYNVIMIAPRVTPIFEDNIGWVFIPFDRYVRYLMVEYRLDENVYNDIMLSYNAWFSGSN